MIYWPIPVVISLLALAVWGLTRLKIPRDPKQEKEMLDPESVQAYDQVSRWILYDIIRCLMFRQLDRLHPQGTLIDVGCGTGRLALAIATKYPSLTIIGLDNSREMLKAAQKNRDTLKPGAQIQFQEASAEHLPLPANSVDFVISSLSLHHWSEPQKALLEIHRALRPGGQLLILDPRRDAPRVLFYAFRLGQRFLFPRALRRTNGPVGSIWASYAVNEMKAFLTNSLFSSWRVQKGWGWAYLWGQK